MLHKCGIDSYAVQYTEKYFPPGSSASVAVTALAMAGAKCSVNDDPYDSPGFVCDWSRRDYGMDYILLPDRLACWDRHRQG